MSEEQRRQRFEEPPVMHSDPSGTIIEGQVIDRGSHDRRPPAGGQKQPVTATIIWPNDSSVTPTQRC